MPNFTSQWLNDYVSKHSARNQIQDTKPERAVRHEPLAEAKGEAKGPGRVLVRIESRRSKLIDPDNLCPKYIIDCLRYAQIIENDTAQDIDLQISQVKVGKGEEMTRVEVRVVKQILDLIPSW